MFFFNPTRFSEISRFTSQLTYREKTKTCSKNCFVESEVGTPRTPRHFLEMMVAQRSSLQGYRRSTGDFFPTTWILGLGFCFLHKKKTWIIQNMVKNEWQMNQGKQKKVFSGGLMVDGCIESAQSLSSSSPPQTTWLDGGKSSQIHQKSSKSQAARSTIRILSETKMRTSHLSNPPDLSDDSKKCLCKGMCSWKHFDRLHGIEKVW